MLAHRLRRRPNIGTTFDRFVVFAGIDIGMTAAPISWDGQIHADLSQQKRYIEPLLAQYWASVVDG